MSKKLAITGITGKSGMAFANNISNNISTMDSIFPDGIRVVVRDTLKYNDIKRLIPSAELEKGDLTNVDFLKNAFKGVDTVVHIAGIHWTREVITAAAFDGVRRVILVHTTGIYSKYKAAGEEYRQIEKYVYDICKESGIVLTILRPTMIYGNVNDKNVIKFIKMVDKLPIMPVVNGAKYELQPVHFADLGAAYYDVLVNESATLNKEFILSGGSPITLRKMLLVIGVNLNKRVKFISCPFPIAYMGAVGLFCLSLGKIDYREKVQRLCESRDFPHDDARESFGYSPVNFEDGIKKEVEEYKLGK